MRTISTFTRLSDAALLETVARLAVQEAGATAELVASLAVLDERRAYRALGYGSLFAYCVGSLGLSEDAAYRRIEVARAARRVPAVLPQLATGTLTLTAASLLARHLTPANAERVLARASHRTKREIEELVAELQPQPDVPASLRRLPTPRGVPDTATASPAGHAGLTDGRAEAKVSARALHETLSAVSVGPAAEAAVGEAPPPGPQPLRDAADSTRSHGPEPREAALWAPLAATRRPPSAVIAPLAPARYRLQVTLGAETHAKLRRAQALLAHAVPDGDPAAILDRALTLLVADLEKRKSAATTRPRPPRTTTPDRGTGSAEPPAAAQDNQCNRILGRQQGPRRA